MKVLLAVLLIPASLILLNSSGCNRAKSKSKDKASSGRTCIDQCRRVALKSAEAGSCVARSMEQVLSHDQALALQELCNETCLERPDTRPLANLGCD